MANKMLIDATHPEETRVVVLRGNRVEEFDFKSAQRKQLRGNIYLAKVTRVEPSLQAAFVDYGGNRHGFLAFSEIHPDYYQIPVADRQALIDEEGRAQRAADDEDRSALAAASRPRQTFGGAARRGNRARRTGPRRRPQTPPRRTSMPKAPSDERDRGRCGRRASTPKDRPSPRQPGRQNARGDRSPPSLRPTRRKALTRRNADTDAPPVAEWNRARPDAGSVEVDRRRSRTGSYRPGEPNRPRKRSGARRDRRARRSGRGRRRR